MYDKLTKFGEEILAGRRHSAMAPVVSVDDAEDVIDGVRQSALSCQALLLGELDADRAWSLLLLRGDLQAVAHGLAAVVFLALRGKSASVEETLWGLLEETRRQSEAVDKLVDETMLRRLLDVTKGSPVPSGLSVRVSIGPNPWFIECADPRARMNWTPQPPTTVGICESCNTEYTTAEGCGCGLY